MKHARANADNGRIGTQMALPNPRRLEPMDEDYHLS